MALRTAQSGQRRGHLGDGFNSFALRLPFRSLRRDLPLYPVLASLLIIFILLLLARALWQSRSAGPPPLSARQLTLTAAVLPNHIQLAGRPLWGLSLTRVNAGLPSAILQDRQDGYRDGLSQDFRDGARSLRLVAKLYASSGGATHAYANAVTYLHASLFDSTLHARVRPEVGVGSSATFAIYDSAAGNLHYTVSVLVFLDRQLVGEIQAFPSGLTNGRPSIDHPDLRALGRLLAARLRAPAAGN